MDDNDAHLQCGYFGKPNCLQSLLSQNLVKLNIAQLVMKGLKELHFYLGTRLLQGHSGMLQYQNII